MVMAFATGVMSSLSMAAVAPSEQAAAPKRKNPAKHSCPIVTIDSSFRLLTSLGDHQIRFALLVGVTVGEREFPRRVPLHLDPQVLLEVLAELWRRRFVPAVKLQLPRVAREVPDRYA